jgi:hypothetical protein
MPSGRSRQVRSAANERAVQHIPSEAVIRETAILYEHLKKETVLRVGQYEPIINAALYLHLLQQVILAIPNDDTGERNVIALERALLDAATAITDGSTLPHQHVDGAERQEHCAVAPAPSYPDAAIPIQLRPNCECTVPEIHYASPGGINGIMRRLNCGCIIRRPIPRGPKRLHTDTDYILSERPY